MKFLISTITIFLFAIYFHPATAQICGSNLNNVIHPGEEVKYKVFYTVGGAWTGTGEAAFTTSSTTYNGRAAYHIVGTGRTYSSYDWIFKVRDRYETYIDKEKLVPMKFKRNVSEGKTKFTNDVTFNHGSRTAKSDGRTFSIESCTQDVLSTIYFARNIDFSKYSVGSKIPFTLFLDNELHSLYIKYMGKTKIKTQYGTFNAIKIVPLLIEGTIFRGGEKMIVYVSDDDNHIPLRIETPILVGNIKVDLMSYKNLRYPLSSKIQ
ncbi:MAG: DUF3108 domain-containing protein [Taibaiella sp.]|nr:DUF3108 domain-containing protein [Taibaiella sp.]